MQSVYEDLVFYGIEASDPEDAIRKVGAKLFEQGFVRDTYVDAVAAREIEYPTGLQLATIGVAMPHTTGVHVITPAVCVVKLAHPVVFNHMGYNDGSNKVNAEMLFMMAIKDPNLQLETLQKMMGVFSSEEALAALSGAANKEELWEAARKYIG